ncbi:hypothetical protein NPX13_g909 [Xylaria arbuscula]|uniref:Uncharacterized protein n=1 Tax=Xylaria arbuscula TaxID=114810 RepID=A0A9W8NM05_9PEZI|nr:hypothetical protein NPX13_g909 [Xylaria arbuscula]
MNPLLPLADHQFNPFEPHPELDGVEVPDVDWVNNSDPFGIFTSRGMAAPKIPSPNEVRQEAKQHTVAIFAHYEKLRNILQRHEATIQKRVALQHRASFIWPMINQEDLGDPKTLPLLLNSRGRNHPHLFAASDGEAMHLGKVTSSIVPIFLNIYVMMLNGMARQEDYGKLVAWEEHEDAFDWMHTRKQFLPGEGLLILEFQERLLGFLIECCRSILHDIPLDQMTSDKFAIQPEPQLKKPLDAAGYANLSIMAKEAPYRPPAKLDLQKIESLLSARTVRAEDHIWSLREDPSYFAETMLDMKEHLPDTSASARPLRDHLSWAQVTSSILIQSFSLLESFTELRNQAAHLAELARKYEPELSPQKDLPEENTQSIETISTFLTALEGVPTIPEFYCENPIKKDKITQRLIWLLQTLWEDGNNLFLCRLTTAIDELDRLLKAEPKASELVSPYIAMLIGELSITGECLRQLEIFQPWANTFEQALVDREDGIKKEFKERTKDWDLIIDTFKEKNCATIGHLGDPVGGKFQYPVGKRQNKVNVETLRASEANLDWFWNAVDDMLCKKAGDLSNTAYRRVLSQPRYLQRTPKWVEPAAKKEVDANRPQNSGSYEYLLPHSRLFQGADTALSARVEALALGAGKTKVKRRGVPGDEPVGAEDALPSPPGNLEDHQPTFKVDSRALKVFRTVFFDPAANTTAGEVAWRDFLHAMDSTGFAAEKLYGSVWHFQPTTLDVERSIQFHEPHPRGKIPFLVARRHGRRLNRAYGWHGSMFVLKDHS